MVNIEEIMREIREEIKEKGLDKEIPAFEANKKINNAFYDSFDLEFFLNSLDKMNRSCLINPNKPITGNRIVTIIKKVIRKFTRFYIAPIASDQSEFNISAVRVANSIRYYIQEEQKDKQCIEDLIERIAILEKKIAKNEED